MAAAPNDLVTRLAKLEKDLRALSDRVKALELSSGRRPEHSVDRSAVRDKVTYDWQS